MASATSSAAPLIRYATEDDVPTILALITELATYENAASSVFATPASLLATLTFPSDPTRGYAKTLLIFPAEPAATSTATAPDTTTAAAAGFALFYPSYSTWEAAPGIFLEDLFVRPAQRGRGYGKQLLARLAAEVVRMGGRRLEWNVLKWNAPSLAFYERVGAERRDEWVGMRVEGAALVRLAGAGGQEGGGG